MTKFHFRAMMLEEWAKMDSSCFMFTFLPITYLDPSVCERNQNTHDGRRIAITAETGRALTE